MWVGLGWGRGLAGAVGFSDFGEEATEGRGGLHLANDPDEGGEPEGGEGEGEGEGEGHVREGWRVADKMTVRAWGRMTRYLFERSVISRTYPQGEKRRPPWGSFSSFGLGPQSSVSSRVQRTAMMPNLQRASVASSNL